MDDDKLKPIYDKLDKHSDKFVDLEKRVDYSHWRHDQTEKIMRDQCKIMTETREEVVTLFNSRMNQQDKILSELVAQKYKKEGEEEANKKNRQEQSARTTFIFSLINSLPNIIILAGALMGIWLIAQQFLPHK